ncbi:MAG TPA: BON domain-containing protein [Terriglobales bacterium]|nr:BON domain-containing protein [Terriglobales bacterium]
MQSLWSVSRTKDEQAESAAARHRFPIVFAVLMVSALVAALAIGGCSTSPKKPEATAEAGAPGSGAKMDNQLAGEIQAKLNSDPLLSASQRSSVGVRVQGGVATLTGWVVNDAELTAALNAAQGVEGVKQVVSRLQVGQEFAAMPSAAPAFANAPEQAERRYQEAAPRATRKPTPVRSTSRAPHTASTGGFNPYNNGGQSSSAAVPTNSSVGQSAPQTVAAYSAPVTPVASEPVYKEPQRITIPAGTEVPVRLIDAISSETSNVDQLWRGTVNGDIVVDEQVVIPSGSEVEGRIVEVKKSSHYTGAAQLTLQMSRVTFGGKSYTIASDQWSRKGVARGGNTAKKVGAGAAVGAVLGGIFGGGKGAAIGAAAGAGAGAGANTVTKGEKVELDSESLINFRLASAVTVVPVATRERGYVAPVRRYVPPVSTSDEESDRPVLKRRG